MTFQWLSIRLPFENTIEQTFGLSKTTQTAIDKQLHEIVHTSLPIVLAGFITKHIIYKVIALITVAFKTHSVHTRRMFCTCCMTNTLGIFVHHIWQVSTLNTKPIVECANVYEPTIRTVQTILQEKICINKSYRMFCLHKKQTIVLIRK